MTVTENMSIIGASSCAGSPVVVKRSDAEKCGMCGAFVVRTFDGLCLVCQVELPDLIQPTSLRVILGLCPVGDCDEPATIKVVAEGFDTCVTCGDHAKHLAALSMARGRFCVLTRVGS